MNYKSVYTLKHIMLTIYLQNIQELLIVIAYNKDNKRRYINMKAIKNYESYRVYVDDVHYYNMFVIYNFSSRY